MDNTKLIERAQELAETFPGSSLSETVEALIAALEAAEAALKFKQGLIEDISRDCERAEAELTRRDTAEHAATYDGKYRCSVCGGEMTTRLERWVHVSDALAAAPVSLEAAKAETTEECDGSCDGMFCSARPVSTEGDNRV